MAGNPGRIVSAFVLLVAVWIAVYWLWEPGGATRISFDSAGSSPPAEVREASVTVVRQGSASDGDRHPPPAQGVESVSPAPQVRVIPPEFRPYTIRQGDTLASISRSIYGTEKHAGAIAKTNALMSPTQLKPGREILVPKDPENIQGKPVSGASDTVETPGPIEYTVQKGDTLSSISQKFYGSTRYVDAIFLANRKVLKSRDDLRAGQKLLIPPGRDVSDA